MCPGGTSARALPHLKVHVSRFAKASADDHSCTSQVTTACVNGVRGCTVLRHEYCCTAGFTSTLSMHAHPSFHDDGNLCHLQLSQNNVVNVCTHAPTCPHHSQVPVMDAPRKDANTKVQPVCLEKRDRHRMAWLRIEPPLNPMHALHSNSMAVD